ncbi:hypothetical protein [Streptomyces sp. PSKA30]|uniref:hypothetical protein n=1 Tax=Streptomyces sp. PSKA30 TaxID=2874597 RepID=UPI001CD10129|nr:hypothetical protein [Streptomyces sp. PSKA30]MBZ9644755.1 hypothetical protein [Streptomyces sp. PSKA30]
MERLFRFALTRPAIAQDDDAPSVRLAQNSAFQAALGQAQHSGRPRDALKRVARQFIASAGFVADPGNLPVHDALQALGTELDDLESSDTVANSDVVDAIKDAFGKEPADLLKDKALEGPMEMLRDSIIAIKLLPEEHHRPIEALTNQLRDLELIRHVVAANAFPGDGGTLRRYRRRSLLLPSEADLRSVLSTSEQIAARDKRHEEEEEKKRKEAAAKLDLYKRLGATVDELTSLAGDAFMSTPQRADAGFLAPATVRPVHLLVQEVTQRQQRSQWLLFRENVATERGGEGEGHTAELAHARLSVPEGAEALSPKAGLIRGSAPFTPIRLAEVGFRLKPTVVGGLSRNTQDLLRERGLSLADQPLDLVAEALRTEMLELSRALDTLLGRPVRRSLKRIGNTMVMISTPLASVWNKMVVAGDLALPVEPLPANTRVPRTHGSVKPAGVADLFVVKQQLVGYEAADVAHIENVLKGEKKERDHARRRETEEFTLRETEITTAEERELESTTRFEMSRETSRTITEDASLKAGLTVSGKYGPTVEFSASAEGSVARSREEATKSAATFSQDVTDRSATKITERVLERSSLRVTNEVIEKNTHALDNTAGTGHISGVYQWVNKVYQAQMFNYGIRMMYDLMVPEPAAFLISALEGAHANAVELTKPTPFTLRPDQITEKNYFTWVHEYGATDVQPPPELYRTKSHEFNANAEDKNVEFTHSAQIAIDDGYKAVYGTFGCVRSIWESDAIVDVVLGLRSHRFKDGDWVWGTSLNDETDSIPVALVTVFVGDVAVAVEVKCMRTDRALLKWRLDTHAKLTEAYKARLSEYEEKLAALEVQAGVAIRGKNPALNLELMNDELKKHCIAVLTDQHFDLFNAIQTGSFSVPETDLLENAAEGPYVRFFEQAFEWEQMTWVAYPYFWGRKSEWTERVAYEDADPVMNQFLKAGYCRVVVPARLGFEGAIDHFMTFGEVWNGGPLPAISNPLYLPIADEIAERLDRPGEETLEGDPWFVRVPTTLVHLRADDKLPAWTQDTTGAWVES